MAIFAYDVITPGTHFLCAAFFTFQLFIFMVFKRDDYADTKSDSAY
jgi:hypothetical protein